MKINPYFSLIIPSYNRAHSIKKAINSILAQSFQDFEIIVIDDCSTDDTTNVIESMRHPKIHYFRNELNQERCVSRNIGIQKATGTYICFLDSDDYHLPHHFEILYEEIQKQNEPKGFFFTNSWNETSQGVRSERGCPVYSEIEPYTYFLHYTVNPQRWAVHKEVLGKHAFDPEIVICEDMDTSLRILVAGVPIYHINERTTVYVAAEDSFTMSDSNKAEKELFYLKKIFKRKELQGKLPRSEKNRLISMCYYFLAIKCRAESKKRKTMMYSISSFLLCPKGYNGKTNKSIMVMCIYSIPFIGQFINVTRRTFKK